MIRVLYGSGVGDRDPQAELVNEFEVPFVCFGRKPVVDLMSTAEVLVFASWFTKPEVAWYPAS